MGATEIRALAMTRTNDHVFIHRLYRRFKTDFSSSHRGQKEPSDTMVEKGFQILVGDAKAPIRPSIGLAGKPYRKRSCALHGETTAGTMSGTGRRVRFAPPCVRGFDYFSLKDLAMAESWIRPDAVGWKEQGHDQQCLTLSRRNKPVVC